MNSTQLTGTEVTDLAAACGYDADELAAELARRPWALHDVLSEPDLVDSTVGGDDFSPVTSPFVFFAVVTRLAADNLLTSSYVNDWVGPRTRLPVFDVEPVQEFVAAPGRVLFIARLLTSMVEPVWLPIPASAGNPWDLVEWLSVVSDDDRVLLLRRVGDVSLYMAGVHADALGHGLVSYDKAERVGMALHMSDHEIGALCDPASATPGLDALERVSARSYQECRKAQSTEPPVVSDIAERMNAARRFLTHLADEFLSPLSPNLPFAA
ncbi:MAG: hypothetical protein AAGC53_20115 [Actinomycetota bacterium]